VGRILIGASALLVFVALLVTVAPFLLLGAAAFLVVAWWRPAAASRISQHPRLELVPASARSTPMRLAATLLAVTFILTAASAAIGGRQQEPSVVGSSWPTPEATARTATELSATPRITPSPTEQPTLAPTRAPTPEPTATPRPRPVFGEAPTGPREAGVVVHVVDGDTIDVLVNGQVVRVRYIGIDTPEVHSGVEWMGRRASAVNARLVAGKRVVLEKDVSETDQYGRALRYVWVRDGSDWTLVNLELLRRGLASVTTYPPDVKYVDALYLDAQRRARAKGVGLWGVPPTPEPTPVPAQPTQPPASSNCHASYQGYCVTAGIGDWDCAGGSGNGPNYLPVTVRVVGYDEFGLDGDGDGLGCE
jgi:endonuclease YncB( thermonuclease family)